MVLIEVSAYSPQWAIEAQKFGAGRVELCAGIMEGGTTPSAASIQMTRELVSIPLFVIVRPRGGNFYYNHSEFETMCRDIAFIKKTGVDGVVIGMLCDDNQVDIGRTRQLVEIARPMEVTFHRAFDKTKDPFMALEEVIETGCDRILTSGLQATALEGAMLIAELRKKAAGRIKILAGSGIDDNNIVEIRQSTGCDEFHLSAKRKFKYHFVEANKQVNFNLSGAEEDFGYCLDPDKLKKVLSLVKQF